MLIQRIDMKAVTVVLPLISICSNSSCNIATTLAASVGSDKPACVFAKSMQIHKRSASARCSVCKQSAHKTCCMMSTSAQCLQHNAAKCCCNQWTVSAQFKYFIQQQLFNGQSTASQWTVNGSSINAVYLVHQRATVGTAA
jgi:hypothetical protein